jgi:hypothetical protein
MSLRRSLRVLLSVFAVVLAMGASAAGAQPARAVGVTPPRLSFLDGEVSYWRPGAEDWVPAQINTALAPGDSVFAGDNGNVELEIGTRAYVRAGSGTTLGVESLETGYLQLRVPAGHATVDARRLPDGQEIEVDTPNGAFLISHIGYYRFDVDDQATRFSARRGGIARVVPAGGEGEIEVGSAQQVVVTGTETAQLERIAAATDDAWDRWNYDRTGGLGEQPRSVQYVSPEVAGVDDLDRYGDWHDTPNYGNVWVPRGVAAEWSPYSTGRWVWDGYYGWTWVDDSPWGWAPYHYGRWCYVDNYWAWAPGPIVARPVYSPALVAFFGGGGVGVSVSVGTPFVSWVPLGYGEPVVPWWGPHGFVGRPYWGGWGGPRYVNHTEINNTTIINVNNINHYDNFRARNAVVGVSGDRFGRGRITPVRIDAERARDLRPVRGELGVRPTRASLVPREGRGQRPPDRIQNRQVVATRAPQDPSRLPRSAGLVRSDDQQRPQPRIVSPRIDRTGGGIERGRGRDVAPPTGMERGSIERGSVEGRGSVERGRGANERPSAEARGTNPAERGNDERINRIPGEGRGAPRVPGSDERGPRDRDRNGRDVGAVERGNAERGNVEPTDRLRQNERSRPSRDEVPTPPHGSTERGPNRIEQPREQGNRGHDRPERMQRNEAPERARIQQPEPPRTERQESPRNERAREGTAPRSFDNGGDRGGHQRIEQPRDQPREQPRQQRMEAPSRNDRGPTRESSRESFQRQPQMERPAPPRKQHQEQPRMERGGGGGSDQPASQPHGGGNDRAGGGNDSGGHGGGRGHEKDRN